MRPDDVRFGSLADMCSAKRHVRFAPNSGHMRCNSVCPLCAKSGHFQETVLYNPSTMNARDFVALIRMAVISFVF